MVCVNIYRRTNLGFVVLNVAQWRMEVFEWLSVLVSRALGPGASQLPN